MPDRIQQEIEELLAKLDTFPPRRSLLTRVKSSVAGFFAAIPRAAGGVHLPSLSAGHVLLLSIAVIVVAYLAFDGTDLGRWIIAGSIIVFIAAFVFSLRRQSRPPQKMWRDRPLDLRDKRRSWWDRWRTRR